MYTYIQSRFYRSPEVILGMNYNMAIDMWSLGCILAELYTGYPIFPGENEQEQLACIMEVLGLPDKELVQRSSRRKLFFGKGYHYTRWTVTDDALQMLLVPHDRLSTPRDGGVALVPRRSPKSFDAMTWTSLTSLPSA